MSIQQNFPAISPSLNLNFARSKTLDPRITFSRTSTATRVNEQGLVEVVSADTPRFDHEYDASTGVVNSLGLLVEESRVNYARLSGRPDVNWILDVSGGNGLSFIDGEIVTSSSGGLSATYIAELSTSSQIVTKLSSGYPAGVLTGQTSGATRNITSQLSPGGATNVSATLTNEVVSPDGTQNAYIISPTTTGTQLRLVSKTYVTSTAGTYTFSIFFKNKNLSSNTVAIRLANQDATAHVRLNFNFATKTFSGVENSGLGGWTGTYGYQDYPNDWIRIWVTATTTADSHTFISGNFWLGGYQGTAETIGSLYVWESQIEQGAFPTSQIKTTLSTATRNPDNVSMTGDNFSDWYNPTEGTMLSIFNTIYEGSLRTGSTPGVWGLAQTVSENNTFNGYGLAIRADTRKFSYTHRVIIDAYNVNVSLNNSIEAETIQPYTKYKVSCSYADNELKMSPNGQETLTRDDANYGLLPKTTLFIGFQRFGGASPYELTGHISQLTYYPRRLTNTQLQNLTK